MYFANLLDLQARLADLHRQARCDAPTRAGTHNCTCSCLRSPARLRRLPDLIREAVRASRHARYQPR
jgi:hypothetical protein